MVLSDKDLLDIYFLGKRASLVQLVSLAGLFQSMSEVAFRQEQDALSLLISKEEKI